jgi:hypothetical protein
MQNTVGGRASELICRKLSAPADREVVEVEIDAAFKGECEAHLQHGHQRRMDAVADLVGGYGTESC